MISERWCVLIAIVLWTPIVVLGAGNETEWSINGATSYSSGNYGSSNNTRILYTTVTIKRFFSRGYVATTMPYIDVDDSATDSTESGLGDILLKGGLYALEENDYRPGIDLVAKIKLPTANENAGLGTGALDYGGGAELYKWLRYPWIGFLDAYLMIIGDSPVTDSNTQPIWDIGLGHQTTRAGFNSVFLEYRTAIASGQDDSVSVYYFGSYRSTRKARLFGSFEVGLTDGAPDYAINGGLSLYIFK